MLSVALCTCWVGVWAASAAVNKPALERALRAWIAGELWSQAQAEGVSRKVFDRAFSGITIDWSLPELAPPGKEPSVRPHHQAEFRSPGAYFNENALDAQARTGRALLGKWRKTLATIERRYGVPPAILIALWARESAFGRAAIPYSAIRSLASEAFIGERKAFFRRELLAALKILQAGDATPRRLKSSWAGSLGQPQFLPSQFLRYAVDFDRDGKRDIWGSVPDSLASMANYLRAEGWQPARGWGVEVKVPGSVPCTLEGPEQGKPMAAWARMGIVRVDGRPLPGATGERIAYLLMPAGRLGPAFLVTPNFYVLKAYNYSDLYALYVGHLSDRVASNHPFKGAWRRLDGFTRTGVKAMQDRLVAAGYDVGKADGLIGFKTRIAVGLVQKKAGESETCWPDRDMLDGRGKAKPIDVPIPRPNPRT